MIIFGRILIVDDEPDICETISYFLKPHFQEIYLAKNGVEALQVLAENPIDAILSDINMPFLNGIALLKSFREKGHLQPFVILTGNRNQESVLEALRLGAYDYLDKPFDAEQLVKTTQLAVEIGEQMNIFNGSVTNAESLAEFYRENQSANAKRLQRTLERHYKI